MDDYDDYGEPFFIGECICDHPREEHGWGRCDNYDEDCPCPAGWEE